MLPTSLITTFKNTHFLSSCSFFHTILESTRQKMDPYMHDSPSSSVKIKVLATPKMVEDGEDDVEDEEEEEEEDQEEFGGVEYHYEESNLKKTKVSVVSGVLPPGKKGTTSGGGGVAAAPPCCQVEKCEADLSDAKKYHKRHKVCEVHAKSPVVIVAGFRQRFCQQCSRFHVLSEFDDAKRSCRRRLAGHNERRRKNSSESRGGGGGGGGGSSHRGSNQYLKEDQCRQVDESGSSHRAFPGDSTLKNVHIH